jgi:hypothetical protein
VPSASMTGPSFLEAWLSSSELLQATVMSNAVTATASRITRRVEYDRVDENFILFVVPVGPNSGHDGVEVGQTNQAGGVCCMS